MLLTCSSSVERAFDAGSPDVGGTGADFLAAVPKKSMVLRMRRSLA